VVVAPERRAGRNGGGRPIAPGEATRGGAGVAGIREVVAAIERVGAVVEHLGAVVDRAVVGVGVVRVVPSLEFP
jgi:hypothetical protein